MKRKIEDIVNRYLTVFENEKDRLNKLLKYTNKYGYNELTDETNYDGHIVVSGLVYSKTDKKFLILYHKDLQMYLYPGGHIKDSDYNLFFAAKRELFEETGLADLPSVKMDENEIIPFDIDTHMIAENNGIPSHFHFDFRYVFIIDKIRDVYLDSSKHSDYKWITIEEMRRKYNYGDIILKLEMLIKMNEQYEIF